MSRLRYSDYSEGEKIVHSEDAGSRSPTLIIAHGPFVLYAAVQALRQGLICPENTHLWTISRRPQAMDPVTQLVPAGVSLLHFGSSPVGQVRALSAAKEFCRSIALGPRGIFYVANLCHVVTNFLAFGGHNARLGLLPEGLANFYRPTIRDVMPAKTLIAKQLFARVLGVQFREFSGHISGESIVLFEDVIMPVGFPTSAPNVRLLHSSAPSGAGPASIVVLDTPACDFKDPKAVREGLIRAVEEFRVAGAVVYLKPHPGDKRSCVIGAEGFGLLAERFQARVVDTGLPLELLTEKLQVGTVISCHSTALLTTRLSAPSIRCVSVGLNQLRNEGAVEALRSTFVGKGIEMRDTPALNQ